jgi:hypothetical protein
MDPNVRRRAEAAGFKFTDLSPVVENGTPCRVTLRRPPLHCVVQSVTAALELRRRGLTLAEAHHAMLKLLQDGEATIDLPVADDQARLRAALEPCNLYVEIDALFP